MTGQILTAEKLHMEEMVRCLIGVGDKEFNWCF
jgi:hypothetical protein